jgi:hypothetical protein
MKWIIAMIILLFFSIGLHLFTIEKQIEELHKATNEIWKSIDRITAAIEGQKNA